MSTLDPFAFTSYPEVLQNAAHVNKNRAVRMRQRHPPRKYPLVDKNIKQNTITQCLLVKRGSRNPINATKERFRRENKSKLQRAP